MFGFVRFILAVIIVLGLIVVTKARRIFKTKSNLFYICTLIAIILVTAGLSEIPFENQLGGFRSAENAEQYSHGKCELVHTAVNNNLVLVMTSEKMMDTLHIEDGRYFLIPSRFAYSKYAYSSGVGATIFGDKRFDERIIFLSMFPAPEVDFVITDNMGNKFEDKFLYQDVAYYFGSYLDNGNEYQLFIDGKNVELINIR